MVRKPNVLVLMVDEQRHPTSYDSPELRAWMVENLPAQKILRETGVDFQRHYIQSVACAPSRASLFTGQYPSLHGVTQTDGIGKQAWDPGMRWLDPNTVPTLGDWFRAAGYQTYYKGKWHISWADILIPGTKDSLPSNDDAGCPIPEYTAMYEAADRLDGFGFSGWIGPEPHGADKANSGWLRDPLYMQEGLALLDELESRPDDQPWLLVNSFVNPHDIVFFGAVWRSFGFPLPDGSVPDIPPPPTQDEDLSTKPRAQASYVETYPQMFLPQVTIDRYRQFYYFLQAQVDRYILAVYERLRHSRFFDNTIIVFTSDHGDMLGAHGGMHQKWYQAYEETLHVPLIVAGPVVTSGPRVVDGLTSHADLVPTLLGLAGVDVAQAALQLQRDHTEVRPLVGRDLSRVVLGHGEVPPDPVYFMTADDVSQGLSQITGRRQWASVLPPNAVETVIVELDGVLWKYTRYYEAPTSYPYVTNPILQRTMSIDQLVPDEYEMYKLSTDLLETTNLVHPGNETLESISVRPHLQMILEEQRALKCLQPRTTEATSRAEGEGVLAEERIVIRATSSRRSSSPSSPSPSPGLLRSSPSSVRPSPGD